jgi:sugar lactone lactonase YvrE
MNRPLLINYVLAVLLFPVILAGTGCGKSAPVTATTVTLPVITTNGLISNLTTTSAQSGGIITSDGGGDLTASGVCYSSTDQTPTTADSKTNDTPVLDPANTNSFISNITGLTASTTYYLRAYASNAGGTGYGSVVKFTTSTSLTGTTSVVSTLAGSITAGYQDGSGTSALFNGPQGVACDAQGNVYVADGFNNVIRKITPSGSVTTFAGDGNAGYSDGPVAAKAEFYGPQGIAVDTKGNIFVADIGNNVIREITAAGVVSTFAGNGTRGYVNGVDTIAEFNNPQAVAVDASGNVYVADRSNNMIRKITPAGVVSDLAGYGFAGLIDGTGTSTEFNTPEGLTVDASGNVYVADLKNYCIRKITPAGVVTTIAGGLVQTTVIGSPSGMAIDAKGNVYITDQNGRILELVGGNVLYILAGAANTAAFADGSGTAARFNSPQGLTVDASGNIYVADFNNNSIRKVVVTNK